MDPNTIEPGTAEMTVDGADEQGNPTISTNIGAPAAQIGATPGAVE